MLLIGGKNLVPLVSAAVIQSLGWRWVFIIVGIIVALMFVLTYLCVPETCWDRNPLTADRLRRHESRNSLRTRDASKQSDSSSEDEKKSGHGITPEVLTPIPLSRVRFAPDIERPAMATVVASNPDNVRRSKSESLLPTSNSIAQGITPLDVTNSATVSRSGSHHSLPRVRSSHSLRRLEKQEYAFQVPPQDIEPIPSAASQHSIISAPDDHPTEEEIAYRFRKKTYREMLAISQGRISQEKWWKSALRPFILYAYPAIAFVHAPAAVTECWLILLGYVVV
jgi:hypothetical protein